MGLFFSPVRQRFPSPLFYLQLIEFAGLRRGRAAKEEERLSGGFPLSGRAEHNIRISCGSFGLVPKLQRDAEGLRREQCQVRPGAPYFDEPPGHGSNLINRT